MTNPYYSTLNTENRMKVCKSLDNLCACPTKKLEDYGHLKQKRKEAIDIICDIEDFYKYMDSDDYKNEQLVA